MKKLTYSVPAMYADHHVLRVREVLAGIKGVTEIQASAAQRKVTIAVEDGVAPSQIEQALTQAGYAPGVEPSLEPLPQPSQDGSAWYTLIRRITKTEIKDLEMSGDFRRY